MNATPPPNDPPPNDPHSDPSPYRSPAELSASAASSRRLPAITLLGVLLVVTVAAGYFFFSPAIRNDISDFGASRSPPPIRVEADEYSVDMNAAAMPSISGESGSAASDADAVVVP